MSPEECPLANTFRKIQKLCPWYMTCENKHRGEAFACNGNHPDAEYLALLAVQQTSLFRALPDDVRAKAHAASEPPIADDPTIEAEAGVVPRLIVSPSPELPEILGQRYDHTHHRRGDPQLSDGNNKAAAILAFFRDLPESATFSRTLEAALAAGTCGRTTFRKYWAARRGMR